MSVMGSQIWPPIQPSTLTRQVWDTPTTRSLPAVAKALLIYGGLMGSCPLQLVQRQEVLDTPRLLDRPDPDEARPTFITSSVEDYLLNGNASHLVTARFANNGAPAAVKWYPAHRWHVEDRGGVPRYLLDGKPVPREDVVHVKRGQDPRFIHRGMGVVEQHIRTLNRAGLEEAAESAALTDRGTPAVAIITPLTEPDENKFDAAADKWVERFQGTSPKPAFFPKGTEVVPLSWNPSEGQMVEARKLSLVDVANLMGLDGYWIGAETSSHTYRSPGPLFLMLTKVSLGPVMDVFEDVWSGAWFPLRTSRVRFDRTALLSDDLASMIAAFAKGERFFPDPNEPRQWMGFPPLPASAFKNAPAPVPAPVVPDVPAVDPEEVAAS